jgi:glycerol-3-phosphate dehydrogenase
VLQRLTFFSRIPTAALFPHAHFPSPRSFDKDIARHLSRNYGTRALQVAQIAREGAAKGYGKRLAGRHPFLTAEVVFAVEQEYAVSAVDVLARRTRLAFMDAGAAREATPEVVKVMGDLLGWDAAKRSAEAAAAFAFIDTMITPSTAAVNWGAASASAAAAGASGAAASATKLR